MTSTTAMTEHPKRGCRAVVSVFGLFLLHDAGLWIFDCLYLIYTCKHGTRGRKTEYESTFVITMCAEFSLLQKRKREKEKEKRHVRNNFKRSYHLFIATSFLTFSPFCFPYGTFLLGFYFPACPAMRNRREPLPSRMR